MEPTLVSNFDKTGFKFLVKRISKLSIFDQFAQTLFVDHTNGLLEVEKSYRESNILKFVRTEIAYQLKNHRIISKNLKSNNIIISDLTECSTITVDKSICRSVSSNLNKLFIRELESFQDVERHKFNLYSQNIFKKYFFPNTDKKLIDKVIELGDSMSWVIIPYKLLNTFYNSDQIELHKEEGHKIIFRLGDVGNLHIFVNPDEKSGKIYFGNFDSIIIVANKELKITPIENETTYDFEYLFIEEGPIKILEVI